MDPIKKFYEKRLTDIMKMGKDSKLRKMTIDWMLKANEYKYTYNFKWMGRPIIQYPNDMFIIQELVWQIKPDLIIETGIAHGGSIIFLASMLELIGKKGKVIGIDIDIRKHNKNEIEKHPMIKRIIMIEGSSTDDAVIDKVYNIAENKKVIMVILDSNHTHSHVIKEMNFYGKLVTVGSYMVIFDTCIENFPKGYCKNRQWDVGNNPMTALDEFLEKNNNFIIDEFLNSKAILSNAPRGFLKRFK